jgi:hypothetical protein
LIYLLQISTPNPVQSLSSSMLSTRPAPLIPIDLISRIKFCDQYRSLIFLDANPPVTPCLLIPTPISLTLYSEDPHYVRVYYAVRERERRISIHIQSNVHN